MNSLSSKSLRAYHANIREASIWQVSSVIIAGIFARSWLMFATIYVPGINGAYYLVQARSLQDHGHLAVPDLPLTFCLQALLAWVIQHFAGCSQPDSILLAVKGMDTVLPPLAALPVYLVVRTISRDRWLPLLSAMVVVFGAPALRMVGDFQKNSLALVWMAAFIWMLLSWEAKRRMLHGFLAVAFLGLAALTHIGVFGAMLVLGFAFVLTRCIHGTRSDWLIFWPWALLAMVVVTTAAGLVLWQFDPHRIHRLTGALLHPVAFLAPHLHQNPGTGPLGHRPGGPPGLRLEWLPCLVGCAVSLMTIGTIWLRHKDLDLAICCVMGACALCGLVLTGPWVTGDMTMRFALNAVIPLTICGAFCSDQIPANWRATPAAMVALLVIAPSVPLLKHGGEPAISMQALAELRLMTGEIDAAPHSLVVARHGLEWWASWILGTHISQPGALRANDWGTYQNVYVLHLKGLMTMPGPPPSAPPPSADDPMNLGRGPGGDAHGPFRELPIPTSATIVHDGPCFTLARIPGPIPLP